jgi:hypothetical protein
VQVTESDWTVNDFDILRYNYFKIRNPLTAEIILTHNFAHKLYNYVKGMFGVKKENSAVNQMIPLQRQLPHISVSMHVRRHHSVARKRVTTHVYQKWTSTRILR